MKRWDYRGVQLDLGRQKENIEFIKDFVDFIAKCNYNLLVLNLEGRIKTKSFPYLSDEESYQPDEMHEIVNYAMSKGINVMPIISNFSHAEMFLQTKEMQHLAELRGGREGRSTLPNQKKVMSTFCPSLEGTYKFFEDYYSEIAEIFPFEYFHVGIDEVWDIGFCDLCRPRAESEEGQEGIFAKHLLRTYDCITKKIGKKMAIWDDMFELYPSVLASLPKDILLCCWYYYDHMKLPQGHFTGQVRFDCFSLYEKLGFKYMVAPLAHTLRNVEDFTAYALKYNPLGGILTTWSKRESFLFEHYPVIAATGEFWNGDCDRIETAQERSINNFMAANKVEFEDVLKIIGYVPSLLWYLKVNPKAFYIDPISFAINDRMLLNKILIKQLNQIVINEKGNGKNIVEDIAVRIEEENLLLKLLWLIPETFGRINKLYYGESKELLPEIQQSLIEAKSLKKVRKKQWNQHRSGLLVSTAMKERWNFIEESLLDLQKVASGEEKKDTGLLIVSYFLDDILSSVVLELQVFYENANDWKDVACGTYKPLQLRDCRGDSSLYYTIGYRISSDRPVKKLKIESWGYGRQGITFIEAINKSGHFKPSSIIGVNGHVFNPERVMVDDVQSCFLGYQEADLVFRNPGMAKAKHTLIIGFESIK